MDFLLPIMVFSLPVFAIVGLAMAGKKLSKSCGGVGPDGGCRRCGEPPAGCPQPRNGADAVATTRRNS